jgi:hypothetical protein
MKTILRTAAPLAMAALMTIPLQAQEPKETKAAGDKGDFVTVQGTLVDAGCRNRTALNLGAPAETYASQKPAETAAEQQAGAATRTQQGMANPSGAQSNMQVNASGVTIDPKALANQRPDVLEHQVADLRSRQLDPTCAISGATHNFAIYTGDGRFYNLDEGGNTYANEAVLGTAAGRDMLAGNGGSIKPQASINGKIENGKVVVRSIKLK